MLEWIALFRRVDFGDDSAPSSSATMLSLCRDHCLQFLDQISADVRFDAVIAAFNAKEMDSADDALPAFWSFLISTLRAESAATTVCEHPNSAVMEQTTAATRHCEFKLKRRREGEHEGERRGWRVRAL